MENVRRRAVLFLGAFFGAGCRGSGESGELLSLPDAWNASCYAACDYTVPALLDLSRTWQEEQGQMLDYCCSTLLMELTLEMSRESHKGEAIEPVGQIESAKPQVQQAIREAMDYITMNCHKQMDPAMVAQHLHYNPDYFASLFRKQTGMTITQYLNKMRIELAKRLMVNENVSIKSRIFQRLPG